MKTIRVFLFLLSIASLSYAQEQLAKGVINVGGSLSYVTSKTTYSSPYADGYTKTQQTSLTPSFGWFVTNKFQIGASWGYMFYKSRYYSANGTSGGGVMSKQRNYGLNARYYYPVGNEAVFAGAGFVYFVSLDDYVGRSFTGEVGMDFFISNPVAIEPSIQYINSPAQTTSQNALMIAIGFRYFIL